MPTLLPNRTTVLVVGGGPVGLLTSIMLTRLGVDNIVVERRTAEQEAPAAHVVNARTFEIMRAAGVDMRRIEAACRPVTDGWVRWVTNLTGEELGCVPFERQHQLADLDTVTPTPLRNLSQNLLEPILGDHVTRAFRGVEWVEAVEVVDEHGAGLVSTLRDTGTGELHHVRSEYLVGADGAGSPVRRSVGITMEGPQRLESIISIHVHADLRHLVAHRPATLYWLIDPELNGNTFVAHDIDSTWVYMYRWNPDVDDIANYTVDRCEQLFRSALGVEVGPVSVRSITPWNMSCQVADRYRDGRVFLAGDAAHRFPPTGGLGLNTGAVDAQNLAWKLAAVHHGWASPALLDSYEAERRPIAQTNAQQSLENALKLFEVTMALGADADPEVTRRNYAEVMASPERRAAAAAACLRQTEHFDMLGLQLGFNYIADGAAVVDDGTSLLTPDDVVRDYLPTTHPGARLPHAWVWRGSERVSTLDLVPLDRFVLLTSSTAWAAAGRELVGGPVPLAVVLISGGAGDADNDVHDLDDVWAAVAEIGSDGALLVRPDQHVGWRALAGPPAADGALAQLREALMTLVGR